MAKKAAKEAAKTSESTATPKRLSQSEVPRVSLSQALRVARAIVENYGGDPTTPVEVGAALEIKPTSGGFRELCGASIGYGLTTGGCNAKEIAITETAERICEPTEEGDDQVAMREAFLTPRIIREFLEKYDGKQLPRLDIARNVLKKMGVPASRVNDVHELVSSSARDLGLLRDIKGNPFVVLKANGVPSADRDTKSTDPVDVEALETIQEERNGLADDSQRDRPKTTEPPTQNRRVFVTHGKNRELIAPIKRLLEFGQLEPVISVEKQAVSKPVPDKVMDDMRSCSAAIIHVDDELRLVDTDAKERVILNPNVLIEIGAAMGLYGRSFILLVKEGVKLPSNLQGLFEVRYSGNSLDGEATIRLMEAINELKAA